MRNILTSPRNGKVVDITAVKDDDEIMVVSKKGILIRVPVKNISIIGRNTQGVRIMRLEQDDRVVSIAKIEANGDEQDNGSKKVRANLAEATSDEELIAKEGDVPPTGSRSTQ